MTDLAAPFQRRIAWIAGAATAATLLLASAVAEAQEVGGGFAGFATESNEPIDIESDTLEVRDGEKTAIFSGNVKAVQGGMTLRSSELHVDYTGESSGAGGMTSGSEITRITANGKVLINTDQMQTATSDWARFDVKEQVVTIGGNVVLTQGDNVIKGDRLVIDLKTGRSRFENQGDVTTRQRVRGLFRPGQAGGAAAQ